MVVKGDGCVRVLFIPIPMNACRPRRVLNYILMYRKWGSIFLWILTPILHKCFPDVAD